MNIVFVTGDFAINDKSILGGMAGATKYIYYYIYFQAKGKTFSEIFRFLKGIFSDLQMNFVVR